MKIDKINLLKIWNWSHPDFAVFARIINDYSKDDFIEVPQSLLTYLCDICSRPLWLKDAPCTYCLGLKDGKKSVADPFEGHTHTWTAEEKPVCINCNIYKDFLIK